ncbi:hypothetical protein P7C70_g6682, partial [Phenoliferia sp. Uapishka_3]
MNTSDTESDNQDEQQDYLRLPSYHLSLPPELLAVVCAFANNRPPPAKSRRKHRPDLDVNLLPLALISKDWNAAVTREIYGDMEIEWRSSNGRRLLRSFEVNPSLCLLVRTVKVNFTTEDDWGEQYTWGTDAGKRNYIAACRRFLKDDAGNFSLDGQGDDSPYLNGETSEEELIQGYLKHTVAAAYYLKGDSTWLEDRGEGTDAFYKWVSSLSNLRHLSTDTFDTTKRYGVQAESQALTLAAPVLASLKSISMTSPTWLADDTARVNLKVLQHLHQVRRLDLNLSDQISLSTAFNGRPFPDLESLRLKVLHDRKPGKVIGLFRLIPNHLQDLHIFLLNAQADPASSGFLPLLAKELSRLSQLRRLTLYWEIETSADEWDEDWTIFQPFLSDALAKTRIKELCLRTWPPDHFLALLPETITTLAIEDFSPFGPFGPFPLLEKKEVLEKCLEWKRKFLPNFKELRLNERSDPEVDISEVEKWKVITDQAEGFKFTFKIPSRAVLRTGLSPHLCCPSAVAPSTLTLHPASLSPPKQLKTPSRSSSLPSTAKPPYLRRTVSTRSQLHRAVAQMTRSAGTTAAPAGKKAKKKSTRQCTQKGCVVFDHHLCHDGKRPPAGTPLLIPHPGTTASTYGGPGTRVQPLVPVLLRPDASLPRSTASSSPEPTSAIPPLTSAELGEAIIQPLPSGADSAAAGSASTSPSPSGSPSPSASVPTPLPTAEARPPTPTADIQVASPVAQSASAGSAAAAYFGRTGAVPTTSAGAHASASPVLDPALSGGQGDEEEDFGEQLDGAG